MPPSFGVNTTGSWTDYLQRLSSRTRNALSRAREQSEREIGGCEWCMHEPTPVDVDHFVDELVAVERSGWKRANGSSLADRPDLSQFFREYARHAAARGRLRMSVLRFGSEIAAIEMAVEAYHRLWGLKIAYLEKFSQFAPALQLAHASIQSAFTRGLQSYEFLGNAESWQKRWKPDVRAYRLLAVYPFSLAGVAGLMADASARLSRRAHPPTTS
jgi:CelD/BcsL family acetyltransferase involved in cellulose biosynthesis